MKRIEIPIQNEIVTNIVNNQIPSDYTYISHLYTETPVNVLIAKDANNEPFTRDDLISLYSIYNVNKVDKSFRLTLDKIKYKRNIKKDMTIIFDCIEEQIASDQHELERLRDDCIVLLSGIYLFSDDKGYKNLRYIAGNVVSSSYGFRRDLFPTLESIGGSAMFPKLIDAHIFHSLRSIGNNSEFNMLENATGLSNLELILGNAIFPNLTDVTGLEKLSYIGGEYNFSNLSKQDLYAIKKRTKKL